MSVPPGDTARSGHCSSGVCALCPRAVGQGATLDAKTPKAEPTGCGRCSGARTQTPAMGHRLLRAGRLPIPPSIGTARASS